MERRLWRDVWAEGFRRHNDWTRNERNEEGGNAPELQLQHRFPPLFRNPGQELRTESDNFCRPFSHRSKVLQQIARSELTSVLWAKSSGVRILDPLGSGICTTIGTCLIVLVIFFGEIHCRIKMNQSTICFSPLLHIREAAEKDSFTCAYLSEVESFSRFVFRYLLQACQVACSSCQI